MTRIRMKSTVRDSEHDARAIVSSPTNVVKKRKEPFNMQSITRG